MFIHFGGYVFIYQCSYEVTISVLDRSALKKGNYCTFRTPRQKKTPPVKGGVFSHHGWIL